MSNLSEAVEIVSKVMYDIGTTADQPSKPWIDAIVAFGDEKDLETERLRKIQKFDASPNIEELVACFTNDMKNGYGIDLRQQDRDYLLKLFYELNKNVSEEADSLIRQMVGALEEIKKGEGAYRKDQLEHASNCIENMKEIAGKALSLAALQPWREGGAGVKNETQAQME